MQSELYQIQDVEMTSELSKLLGFHYHEKVRIPHPGKSKMQAPQPLRIRTAKRPPPQEGGGKRSGGENEAVRAKKASFPRVS